MPKAYSETSLPVGTEFALLKKPFAFYVCGALALALTMTLWMQWPRRLDLAMGDLQATTYHAKAGTYAVSLTLTPERKRDHGPATLHIKTSTSEITIPTYYNYDTLMDTPAGTWHRSWVDGDLWPDVIVETSRGHPAVFVIRSSDGMIQPLPAQ